MPTEFDVKRTIRGILQGAKEKGIEVKDEALRAFFVREDTSHEDSETFEDAFAAMARRGHVLVSYHKCQLNPDLPNPELDNSRNDEFAEFVAQFSDTSGNYVASLKKHIAAVCKTTAKAIKSENSAQIAECWDLIADFCKNKKSMVANAPTDETRGRPKKEKGEPED